MHPTANQDVNCFIVPPWCDIVGCCPTCNCARLMLTAGQPAHTCQTARGFIFAHECSLFCHVGTVSTVSTSVRYSATANHRAHQYYPVHVVHIARSAVRNGTRWCRPQHTIHWVGSSCWYVVLDRRRALYTRCLIDAGLYTRAA